MSRVADRFHLDTLTVWPDIGRSGSYNDRIYGAPFTVRCNYSTKKQAQVDSSGTQFIPKFTFYVTADPDQIKRGDKVLLGNHLSSIDPADGSEIVREPKVDQVQRRLGKPDVTVFV